MSEDIPDTTATTITPTAEPGSALPPTPASKPDWLVPLVLGSGMMMQTLSAMVIVTALPSISRDLGVDPLRLNLTITLFTLAMAVFTPLSGWMADRFGARRVFVASTLLFALASALCGFAQDVYQLLGARVLQGVAGAMMAPVGRLVLLRTTPRDQILKAMTMLMTPLYIGPLLGPLVGGAIVTFLDWRWIFFINLPIAAIVLTLVLMHVPNVRETKPPRLDVLGIALTSIGMAGLVLGFESLQGSIFPLWLVSSAVGAGVVAIAAYGFHARRRPDPVVDLKVFRHQTYRASVIGGAVLRISVSALPFVSALLFQIGYGMSAFMSGVLVFFGTLGAFVMRICAPPILRAFGFRRVLVINAWLTAGSFLAYGVLRPSTPYLLLVAVILAGGFFRALQFTSINAMAYAEVEEKEMSHASTTAAIFQQLMQSVGVGFAAALLHGVMQLRGDGHITVGAASISIMVMGLCTIISVGWFIRLPADAGDAINGGGRKRGA